jgi:prevent-host-death family protein
MATVIGMHAAKTHLSKLIEQAEAGEEVVITRDGEPVARLVPVAPAPRRQFGLLRGLGRVSPAFFEPLPEDELQAWEGRGSG